MYFTCAAILLASLASMVQFSLPYNKVGRATVLYNFILVFFRGFPHHAHPAAKGSNPATGLILLWAHNRFRENLTTGKSHKKTLDRFSSRLSICRNYSWSNAKHQ
jgi:hypothetical protein